MKHTIDATGKQLGRIATEAATLLMGKDRADFAKNKIPNITVEIVNASKANISEKKLEEKTYKSYSGYPGGLKTQTMAKVVSKKGYAEAFRKAVYGMIPHNKLAKPMMKNLVITE